MGVYWPADNQSVIHGVFEISCKDSMSTEHFTKKTLSVLCHGSVRTGQYFYNVIVVCSKLV